MREAYAQGIGWGDAKQKLFEQIDAEIAPMREKYQTLIAKPADIESILRDGATRLRARYATPAQAALRAAVGLRDLSSVATQAAPQREQKRVLPTFKQYREADGKFYFKLMQGDRELLVSRGFDSPREAGQRIASMKAGDMNGDFIASEGVDVNEISVALAEFRDDVPN